MVRPAAAEAMRGLKISEVHRAVSVLLSVTLFHYSRCCKFASFAAAEA
jgi:hypothetical protein